MIISLAEQVIAKLSAQGKMIATAESCTGGLVVGALTSISGSSKAVYGGFVTYANEAKENMVGVACKLLDEYGAVSEQVARSMAEGARQKSGADITISITGIAGPSGGTKEKPVGLVHFACATKTGIYHLEMKFGEDLSREAIREASVIAALEMVLEVIGDT
jgi:nicotinamide-nucleotide amidase